MASRPPLPHDQIVAYVRSESDKGTNAQILKLRKEDRTYQALFDLIDEFKAQANLDYKIDAGDIPATFSAVDKLLMRLYSGEAGGETARQFIGGLMQSPVFYRRLWAKLAAIAPQPAEAVPELEHVLTEDEILAHIKAFVKPRASISEIISGFISDLTAKVEPAFAFLIRVPRYAYALLLLFIGMVAIIPITLRDDFDKVYVYDARVPVPPASGLRGPSDYSKMDSLFYSFMSNFKLALSDYMRRDYPTTITALENLEPLARTLQAGPENANFLPPLREYYFYLGVSHFALSRSTQSKFEPGEKERHADKAIQFLARADSLAQAHQLSGNDRETFFLGLAYGFGKRHAEAVAQLNKIPANSSYYKDVAKPINEWSRK